MKLQGMNPRLRELVALAVLSVFGCGLALSQGASLTPRLGNSLASRHLEPFRSSRAILELIAHSDDLLNSWRARDDATLIPESPCP